MTKPVGRSSRAGIFAPESRRSEPESHVLTDWSCRWEETWTMTVMTEPSQRRAYIRHEPQQRLVLALCQVPVSVLDSLSNTANMRCHIFTSILSFLFFSLFLPCVLAQVLRDDSPIWVQGAFEDATVTANDTSYNAGGTITVNSFVLNIPRNLLVQFPAAWVPWRDFVASKSDFIGFETLVNSPRLLSTPS